MEIDSRDWCTPAAFRNRNNFMNLFTGLVERSNNLQRCLRCRKPLYYDSISLLKHNLTHLKVILDKLPDQIFQFYEPDQTGFKCEESEVFSEINDYVNALHSDIKSDINDTQPVNSTGHYFDEEILNKDTEENNNSKMIVEQKNIENPVIKLEIEESGNRMNELFGVEQLIKTRGSNNNEITKGSYSISNMIKFEVDEISMDQIFYIENLKKDIELKTIQSKDTSIEQEQQYDDLIEEISSDASLDQIADTKNSNADIGLENNVQSEIKSQLQRFDGNIIKCEIEEMNSDNSMDFEDEEITKKYLEEAYDRNIEKTKKQNIDNTIIKSEIVEISSDNSMDFVVDVENTRKHTEDDSGVDQKYSMNLLIESAFEEINSDNTTKLLHVNNTKKVRRNNDELAKIKKKPRKCPICKNFISYNHLGQHIKEVHTQNEVTCDICNKTLKCKKTLRTHIQNVHHRLKCDSNIDKSLLFHCDHCKNMFYSKDCLQKHMKNVHGKAVKCEICGSRLASEVYLMTHMRRVHYDDGNVHSCEICGKIFKSPRYVRVHMKNSHHVSSKRKTSSRKK